MNILLFGKGGQVGWELQRSLSVLGTVTALDHDSTEHCGDFANPAGVADTGSLVLQPGPGEPRTLSLVPPLHIAVLPARRLYASLAAAWSALQPQADMPTNLLLISGPSKTADIQQVLAFGAHGPKELVIVLVNDLQNDSEVCA